MPEASVFQQEPSASQPEQQIAEQTAHLSGDELQRLVAPIALYPDELVTQILAATAYPDEIAQADQWLQAHPDLKGEELGRQVDAQPWDDSVKALTAVPSVLANLHTNLSWTSSLGDAYINQESDVIKAVQKLRQRAQKAGTLNSTSQQQVTKEGKTIVITPGDPAVVYVPQYDPWLVYGAPLVPWPGWYGYPGFIAGPGLTFGFGAPVGFFGGFGWGFGHWGADWRHHRLLFNHNFYLPHSRAFIDRRHFATGRRAPLHHRDELHRPGGARRGRPGGHHSAFGGHQHGGVSHGFSGRGRSSFGGHRGGGGAHGGGGHRGGHR